LSGICIAVGCQRTPNEWLESGWQCTHGPGPSLGLRADATLRHVPVDPAEIEHAVDRLGEDLVTGGGGVRQDGREVMRRGEGGQTVRGGRAEEANPALRGDGDRRRRVRVAPLAFVPAPPGAACELRLQPLPPCLTVVQSEGRWMSPRREVLAAQEGELDGMRS